MGKIRWMFDGVPGNRDPRTAAEKQATAWESARYAGIYSDLARLGHDVPSTPHHEMERPVLIEHLRSVAGALVRKAVESNTPPLAALQGFPCGPNALTDEDIADALA